MTVSTTVNRAQYDGNGATTVFPYPFRILDASHLVVTVIDSAENETTLTQDTDYTISGVGRYNGGYITLTGGALATGKIISLDRVVPDTQEASIRNQGSYLPEIHEDAFDKLTMIIQGVVSTIFGRALLKPSWLAKYYDAKNNRIANLANPVNAQDATTKSYVDGQVASSTAGWQAGDAALNNKIDANFWRTLRFPENVNQMPRAAVRGHSLQGYNDQGQPVPIFSMTDTADLSIKLASNTGGELVRTDDGDTVQEKVYKTELGTNALRDSTTAGTLDTLLNSTTVGTVDLRNSKRVVPNGSFSGTRWFRNRGVASADDGVTSFDLRGQGHSSTIIKHPSSTGVGDHIYVDYLKNAYIGRMTLDNSALGSGTSQATSKNGQMWIRYAQDSQFDDITFKGGDVLSFCLDNCKNILSTNLRVDYQFRYPSGYSKSPLIVGDYSEKCIFLGGYARSVSLDGAHVYAGDLADNDQANDTKWGFINLIGLPLATRLNANACMWQEGEGAPSNAHFIGMNYYGNGISHGVTQQAVGTDIGCSYRESQVRAVWNTSRFITIGGHFVDNAGANTAGAANSNVLGGIHSDNARFTASVGSYFSGNRRDFQDYTGGAAHAFNSIHSTSDRLSAPVHMASAGNALHLGIVNSQLTGDSAVFSGNSRVHSSIVAIHNIGNLGTFGNGSTATYHDIIGGTFIADGYTGVLVTQNGLGVISLSRCVIRDYASVVGGTGGNVSFDRCTFYNTTFIANDLTAKYINCQFVNCTNAPNSQGLNFSADGFLRPSSARCDVTLAAGGTYTFPSWVIEGRGIYSITVGGRGEDLPYWKGYVYKSAAASAGVVVTDAESTSGAITVGWPSNGYITISVVTAGNYSIKLG